MEEEERDTDMHIMETFVDFFKLPGVSDVLVDLEYAIEVIYETCESKQVMASWTDLQQVQAAQSYP